MQLIIKKGNMIMTQRKTSAKIGKIAAKVLKNPSSSKPVKKVAGSALSQRAPQPKRSKA